MLLTFPRAVWAWHRPLAVFALAMVLLAGCCTVGLVVDHRTLLGQPLWAKPLKFAISFAVYSVTLAWVLSLLPRSRTGWWAASVAAVASALEMLAIVGQAARGTQSHFNMSTPFDGAVYAAMGALVAVIYLSTLTAVVLVLRRRTADPVLTLALRCGSLVAIAGMSVGFLMLRATPEQLGREAAGATVSVVGAHAVGVTDGGPGLWFLSWSTTGGDLRVGHFVGMHALQAIPLLAVLLTSTVLRRHDERVRLRVVAVGSLGYAGVTAIAVWQALRGEPVASPGGATLTALAALATLIAVGLVVTLRLPGRTTATLAGQVAP